MKRLVRMHLVALCALVLASSGPVWADEAGAFAVVTSRDDGPYEGVVAGLRGSLGRRIRVRSLQSEPDDAAQAVQKAKRAGTPLITVGSHATRVALDAQGSGPVIACMIGDAHDIEEAANVTGVLLEFPLETQLEWMRRFVPHGQAIGVIYNPVENRERIARATRIAERMGLRLVAREINRPQDLPGALESLAREADVLLAVTDQMVLSPQTAQAILLFSFRNRIAFSGLSASWVKAGALYALERDYEDLGAQCAEMALQVKSGVPAGSLPPAMPRKVGYALNVRTAEHLKLRLPPELVAGAEQVFR